VKVARLDIMDQTVLVTARRAACCMELAKMGFREMEAVVDAKVELLARNASNASLQVLMERTARTCAKTRALHTESAIRDLLEQDAACPVIEDTRENTVRSALQLA